MGPTLRADRVHVAEELHALGSTVVRRAPRGVSLTALSTMSTLESTGPRRTSELAAAQGVTQPSMTALIHTLERAGCVDRGPDPSDRRAALVTLTAAGEEALRQRRRAGTESMAQLIDALTADEVARLVAVVPVLQRLRELDAQQREDMP